MQLKKLSTLAEIISGYTFRNAINSDTTENSFVLQAKNIERGHKIISTDSLVRVNLPKINSTSLLKKNDIVLVSKGFSLGSFRSALFMMDDKQVVANSSLLIIRVKIAGILSGYISAYLNSDEGQYKLLSLVSGSYIQSISKRRLAEEFMLPIPSIREQQLIVDLSVNIGKQREYYNRKSVLMGSILDSLLKFSHIS
ncbi:hypothetical protein COZ40_03490 [Candidatus Roizmanbacteria bacterium CG_4_10_14_3_um_filter_39_13]|uniref:Type I restriction modification DNA specificity domain-containing protein n=2 Tax=Candidatus Roizmaniibacteriota TaxID=1752723 RepID=A0A2H0KKP8_9BACT|nr:MAG: hypothetical protein COV87_01130 [Candidatus Roizmanbacteria bacterium CG11_big_fil_rev_8_21_14_0_20_37_16]PIX68396.1 MAG: hypothetical protein COZ40_03490 [Candidatus Roizmanbacteria bacterium CG_4_10_14_3_um_filter_39_13]